MVVTSNPYAGEISSTEPGEPVTEPDIPRPKEKPASLSTCDTLSRPEDLCENAHIVEVANLAQHLGVDVQNGLSIDEAAARLEKNGPNTIKDTERVSMFQILLRQVSNSLTLVLVIVLILSFSLHDYIEGGVVTAVVLLNIVVG